MTVIPNGARRSTYPQRVP